MACSKPKSRAVLYMRLSHDDNSQSESESIQNQRKLLRDYAQRNGFSVVREYIDDGWSGTRFDRPQFLAMLRDMRDDRFDVILVKDLSRLGRDYIQTGSYLELIFPEHGVRLISVSDGIDTAKADIDLAPFRNMINEMYARDTSRKITSALRAKMKEGQYIGNFAPYGYAKDPNDKNHLIPDDHAAAIVRQIFCWAAAGERPAVIARRLNECGEPSPAVYRCNIYTALDIDRYSKHKAWTSVGISRILCDKVYLGCVVQGKTHKPSLKIRKTKELPEEEWIVVPDRHEPLISWETFETVQHQRAARRCDRKGAFENLFSGLAFCADCGKAMSTVGTRRKGSVANLACGAYKLHGKSACTNHFIAYEELYDCVLGAVRQYVCLTERECDEIFDRLNRRLQLDMRSKETHRERERLTRELENTRRIMNQLYHDHAAGRLNDDTFYQLLETNNTHAAQQEAALRALPNEEKDAGLQALQARLRNLIRRYANIEELNTTLLFELIERIEVGQGKTVKTEQGKQKQQTVKIFFRFLPEPHIAEWIT